jgi:transposase
MASADLLEVMGGSGLEVGVLTPSILKPASQPVIPLAPQLLLSPCPTLLFVRSALRPPGHTVRLIPPAYVKPYVRRQKNDAADAETICEAVTRPSTRVRSDQDDRAARLPGAASHAPSFYSPADCRSIQSALILPSLGSSRRLDAVALNSCSRSSPIPNDARVPKVARVCVAALGAQLRQLKAQIGEVVQVSNRLPRRPTKRAGG